MTDELKAINHDDDQSVPVTLSWECAFGCGALRVYDGGRPNLFRHLDTCAICQSRIAIEPTDRAAVAILIDRHLL